MNVALSPQTAAKLNQKPGAALSPVASMSHVEIAGVKPPKNAVARLYASEKPLVRTSTGITSVRATTIAPL